MANSRGGWVLYLMLHIPAICFCKIGITGKSAKARARGLDKAMVGFPLPVFFCIVPGAYYVEQWLHRNLKGLSVTFYKGDGATEWFWIIAVPFALAAMGLIWGCEILLIYLAWIVLSSS